MQTLQFWCQQSSVRGLILWYTLKFMVVDNSMQENLYLDQVSRFLIETDIQWEFPLPRKHMILPVPWEGFLPFNHNHIIHWWLLLTWATRKESCNKYGNFLVLREKLKFFQIIASINGKRKWLNFSFKLWENFAHLLHLDCSNSP